MAENYRFGLPIAASTYAEKLDMALNVLQIGMIIIFVVSAIFMAYTLIRFRASRNKRADSNVNKWPYRSFIPDASILAFELALIFLLGLPLWSEIKEELPNEKDSNVVELVAEQFAWGFQYAGEDEQFGPRAPEFISAANTIGIDYSHPSAEDDLVTLNELHIPLGKPTIVYMSSKDVIHSFFIPEFRIKQDTVPGMRIPIWFEPTQTGKFELVCSQLCGLGHYRMKGTVIVYTPEDFKAKMAELKAQKEEEEL